MRCNMRTLVLMIGRSEIQKQEHATWALRHGKMAPGANFVGHPPRRNRCGMKGSVVVPQGAPRVDSTL